MNNTALILFRALPEFKACAPWIQELAEAAFIRGMEEGKRQCGPNDAQDAKRYRWMRGNDMTLEYSEYHAANLNGRGVDPLDLTVDADMERE